MIHKSRLNDFRRIKDYDRWVFEENERDIHFLLETVDEEAIVITHHLPTVGAVPKRFIGSPLTGFFLCDMLSYELHPKIWIFGHTHWHVDFTDEAGTRFLANPFVPPGLFLGGCMQGLLHIVTMQLRHVLSSN